MRRFIRPYGVQHNPFARTIPAHAIPPPRAGEYRRINAPFLFAHTGCNHIVRPYDAGARHTTSRRASPNHHPLGEYRRINAPFLFAHTGCKRTIHTKHHAKRLLGVVFGVMRVAGGEYQRMNAPWMRVTGGEYQRMNAPYYSPLLDALHICATAGIDAQHVAFVDETWHGDAGAGFEGDYFVDVGGGITTQCHA